MFPPTNQINCYLMKRYLMEKKRDKKLNNVHVHIPVGKFTGDWRYPQRPEGGVQVPWSWSGSQLYSFLSIVRSVQMSPLHNC